MIKEITNNMPIDHLLKSRALQISTPRARLRIYFAEIVMSSRCNLVNPVAFRALTDVASPAVANAAGCAVLYKAV
jgi:hypothetical protein